MSKLHQVYEQSDGVAAFAHGYFAHLQDMLARLDTQALERFARALVEAAEREATIYFLGNGGSAATASHYANDLCFGARARGHKPFRTVSLMDNNAVISCVSNDFGYEHVFTAQLEPVLRAGDVVVAMSVSGDSDNILRAIALANRRDATTVGLTGFAGGQLSRQCDIHVHVPSDRGEYGPVEDVFQIIDHMLTSYFQIQRRGGLVGGAEAQKHAVAAPEQANKTGPL